MEVIQLDNTFFIKKELNFQDLLESSWSGAVNTLEMIEYYNLEYELMELLLAVFSEETPEQSAVNDFLWFDTDFICESLGIDEEEYYNEES